MLGAATVTEDMIVRPRPTSLDIIPMLKIWMQRGEAMQLNGFL